MESAYIKDWKIIAVSLMGSLALLLFSSVIGYFLTQFYDITLINAFLGTAPGGMAEMGLTAILVNGDVNFGNYVSVESGFIYHINCLLPLFAFG